MPKTPTPLPVPATLPQRAANVTDTVYINAVFRALYGPQQTRRPLHAPKPQAVSEHG